MEKEHDPDQGRSPVDMEARKNSQECEVKPPLEDDKSDRNREGKTVTSGKIRYSGFQILTVKADR